MLDLLGGAGVMSTLIREQNGAKEILVVGKFNSNAEQTRKKEIFDRILEGEAKRVIEELPDDYFNHLIAGDIQEHRVAPMSIRTRFYASLASGVMFICSIPNICKKSLILKPFLGGWFHYQNSGTRDRTHPQFFADKNSQGLISHAGFANTLIGPVRPKNESTWRIRKTVFGDLVIKGSLVTSNMSSN